jgi:hypothetical protein
MASEKRFWRIPPELYNPLNAEFHFDFDPCPFPYVEDGIARPWGSCNWVNPPFCKKDAINGHGPTAFVRKAIEEQQLGKTSVLILPMPSMLDMLLRAGAEIRAAGRVPWLEVETGERYKKSAFSTIFILRPPQI